MEVLLEKTVKLNRTWKLVFLLEPDQDRFEADWNDDGTPIWGYYYVTVHVVDDDGTLFTGSVKESGCSNWEQMSSCWHMCGPKDATLFGIIYEEAAKLLRSEYFDGKMAAAKGD